MSSGHFNRVAIVSQIILILAGMAVLALWPRSGSTQLLLSLRDSNQSPMVNWLMRHRGRIVGAGPISGSVVVAISGTPPMMDALDHGLVLLNGPTSGCGSSSFSIRT